MSCQVKICGISDEENVQAAVNAGANFIGFVHFPKSPRHVSLTRAAELGRLLPKHVKSVIVTVNPDDRLINDIINLIQPDYIQLHGSESPDRVLMVAGRHQKVIKALSISTSADLTAADPYDLSGDFLMFDAKAPQGSELPGGNGVSFDWSILKGFKTTKPWFLSGGLTPENVAEAIRQSGARFVDVSSGVESAPGVKDAGKIKAFIQAAKG